MVSKTIQIKLASILGKDKVRENIDLFSYLSMRLHVIAEFFYEAQTADDLISAIRLAKQIHIPWNLLSGGSNSVYRTSFVPGITIKNNYQDFHVVHSNDHAVRVSVSSGYPMGMLVEKTIEMGLGGFEYHKGLPGQLGGAIYMNSKWTKPESYAGDALVSARLFDQNGNIKTVNRDYFEFAYDYSILQKTKEILLEAEFNLSNQDKEILKKRAQEVLLYRKKTQPMGEATCGCFFRNITEDEQKKKNLITKSAGYLIDQCGLKGIKKGSFRVSSMHANFIVNDFKGNGKPEDLYELTELIKKKVKDQFDIDLVEEVQISSQI